MFKYKKMKKLSLSKKAVLMIFGFFMALIIIEITLRFAGFVYTPELPINSKNKYVILVLGESMSANMLDGELSWPQKLELILNNNSKGKEFLVVNKAIPGTNTAFILKNLRFNLEKYNPSMVITLMGANDDIDMLIRYEETIFKKISLSFQNLRIRKLIQFINEVINFKIYEHKNKKIANGDFDKKVMYETTLELANYHFKKNNYNEAEKKYLQAISINNEDFRAYEQLGMIYLNKVELENYEEIYLSALEINKQDWIYLGLGKLYLVKNELSKAREFFSESILINPQLGPGYQGLGKLYSIQNNTNKSLEMYSKALEYSRGDSGLYLEIGKIHYNNKDYKKSEEFFIKSLELDTENHLAYNRLFSIESEIGLTNKSKKFIHNSGFIKSNNTVLQTTKYHYNLLNSILKKNNIKHIAIQYPTLNIEDLEIFFLDKSNIIFVSNQDEFEQELSKGNYDQLFLDSVGGTFGHFTEKSKDLIANNVATTILKNFEKK